MPYEPVLLANIHKENSHKLAVYEAGGGYRALRKAIKEMSPDDVLAAVRTAGLRGRGGAGFPTALKWSFLPKDRPGPIYLCVNADESEPGTFVNRVQMEHDPHQIVEGIILSAYATKTTTAYLYLRYEYPLSGQRMQAAIDEAYAAGYLGKNILGSNYSLDLFIHRGAGAYVCGEETGLIESLEGKRAWPRIKPPFPAVEGLFRKPTVVNNVETMACVVHIIDRGVAVVPLDRRAAQSQGPPRRRQPGTKAVRHQRAREQAGLLRGAAGHHRAAGDRRVRRRRVERPQGQGGGPRRPEHRRDDGRRVRHALDFSSLMKVGCLGLGTACLIVMDETYSIDRFPVQ